MPTSTPARRPEILPTTDHRDKSTPPPTGSPWPRIAGAYAAVHEALRGGDDTFRGGADTLRSGDGTLRG
ncbi:hypothetical protein, partial [Streptomyces sp. NPDC101455]|uniref:hypothetical protein n=1 Tax=Streptomyces sp. NPDC101455 TaxID=3366142 RepID=UPI003821DABA